MNQFIAFLFFFFVLSATTVAQDPVPHVKGNVTISVKKGTIECDNNTPLN